MFHLGIHRLLACACMVALGLGLAGVAAAQGFPSRPIRMVVGFGPGGLGDIVARAVAQKMTESLGRQVVVENMPGAGGIAAQQAVARAAPDGHTLLLVSGQNAVSPSLFKSLPFDPRADFTMVSTLATFDFVVVVDSASPLRTINDARAAARADPDRFNIATISLGSVQNLGARLFSSASGINALTVPFKTTGDVVGALKGGTVQVGYETLPGVISQIRSGGLRALAVASARPLEVLPGVPAIAESVPGFVVTSWNGIAAPGKTPKDIVLRLSQEISKAIDAPEVRRRMIDLGLNPQGSTPEDLQATYDADLVRWRDMIEKAGIPRQ